MIIGLYDADFSVYNHTIFNIDLMKMASYYKQNHQFTTLINNTEWDKYSRIIYRKDYYDGLFPSELFGKDWFEYGGRAFTQGLYIPLDKNIEKCHADTSIYEPYRAYYSVGRKRWQEVFNIQMNAEHLRFSLNGTSIWSGYATGIDFSSNTSRTLIFHDYNIGDVKNSSEEISSLLQYFELNKNNRKVGFKFPVQVKDFNEFRKWNNLPISSINYVIQFNGILENEQFKDSMKLMNNSLKYQRFIYNVENPMNIKKIMPQLFYGSSLGVKIILKTNDKKWDDTCKLISDFSNNSKWPTMAEYSKHLLNHPRPHQHCVAEARQIFHFVKENDEELFQQFYNLSKMEVIK